MKSKEGQLGAILAALDRNLQRATYAAVGGVVGLPAQSGDVGATEDGVDLLGGFQEEAPPDGLRSP